MNAPAPRRRINVYFDGGCRPNPGPIEAAVVIRGVATLFDDLGHGTNGDAEWLALICALKLARSAGIAEILLLGDALGVIQQANRTLKTRHASHAHAAELLALTVEGPRPRLRWIKRAQNLAGIALSARHPR